MGKEADAKAAKPKKAPPAAKSLIIWEVKPWGEDTDLQALADKILAIDMDGLAWKTQWIKSPLLMVCSRSRLEQLLKMLRSPLILFRRLLRPSRMMCSPWILSLSTSFDQSLEFTLQIYMT